MNRESIFDTRNFEGRAQGALVLSLFDGLREGQSFVIVTDNDPSPLCQQLDSFEAANLHWEYVQKTRDLWALRIAKLTGRESAMNRTGGCCGSCGGHGHGGV